MNKMQFISLYSVKFLQLATKVTKNPIKYVIALQHANVNRWNCNSI